MSQGRNRSQSRGQSKQQSQVRAQLRKQRAGDAYDELDLFTGMELPVGSVSSQADYDFDDGQDPDRLLQGDGESDAAPAQTNDDNQGIDNLSLVHRITRQRHPKVLFRCVINDDQLAVIPLVRPRGEAAEEAIDEICETIRLVLSSACDMLDAQQWNKLVGVEQATVTARLYLLTLVQMKFGKSITVNKRGTFKLSDREFSRYASKYMLLPDGLPVTLRLLFRDGRGSSQKDGTALWDLPDSILLNAVRACLARESRIGSADDDADLAFEIRETLTQLMTFDVLSGTSTDKEVRRLREKFKRAGMGDELPNRVTRQRAYDKTADLPDEVTE